MNECENERKQCSTEDKFVVGIKKNQETKIDVNVGKHDTHVVGRVLATVRMELALFMQQTLRDV